MRYENMRLENLRKIKVFEDSISSNSCNFDGSVDFFPRYVQLEHTTRCNARCIMCNHLYTGNRGAKDLDADVLDKIEEILQYVETVMLNGDGEPFLCKNVDKSFALFGKYGVKVGTNTNLSVLPDIVCKYLCNGFSFINVSCDGSTKELYEHIRRGLSYDGFVANLNKINALAPSLKKNLDFVLMRQNIHDMQSAVEFAVKYKFDSIRFHLLGVNPIIANGKDAPELYAGYLSDNIAAAVKRAEELGIAIQVPNVKAHGCGKRDYLSACAQETASRKRISEVAKFTGYKMDCHLGEIVTQGDLNPSPFNYGSVCRWAIERCFIDVHGNMTTCCYNVEKRFGNLLQQSFSDVWNGNLYKMFRKEMLSGRLPIWCKTCQWLKNPEF